MLNPNYTDKDVDYLDRFLRVKVYGEPYCGAPDVLYKPNEGKGKLVQKKRLHKQFYVYFCAIYEIVASACLVSDDYIFQSPKANYLELFNQGNTARDIVSATSERSRL